MNANEAASRQRCQQLLAQLDKVLAERMEEEYYFQEGGYAQYQNDVDLVIKQYSLYNDLGVKVSDSDLAVRRINTT